MASRENQHDQPIVLDLANQAIRADPVAPKTMRRAAQSSSIPAWIIGPSDALAQIAQDLSLSGWIKPT
jgi:hypothetical protein